MVIAVHSHKIAYMALPKAACSSVKAALAQIDGEARPDAGFTGNKKWHAMYPTSRFRPHRWKVYGDDWYRFCVVRDPVKRLTSCYLNRVVGKRELFNSRNISRGRVDLPPMPDPDFFFQNLKAYMDASSVIRHHALPSWLFVGKNLNKYDDVFTTSQLPDLAAKLSERAGKTVHMVRENATSQKLGLNDLAPKTLDSLREFVAAEYEFLGQYFDNPFKTPLAQLRAA